MNFDIYNKSFPLGNVKSHYTNRFCYLDIVFLDLYRNPLPSLLGNINDVIFNEELVKIEFTRTFMKLCIWNITNLMTGITRRDDLKLSINLSTIFQGGGPKLKENLTLDFNFVECDAGEVFSSEESRCIRCLNGKTCIIYNLLVHF